MHSHNAMRANIGCGMTPTNGWINLDNSWSVRLAGVPRISTFAHTIGLISDSQYSFISFLAANQVRYANATASIPLPDESLEVVYSSHMIEHLDRSGANSFLQEVRRVLAPKGILRLVAPDIGKLVSRYTQNHRADDFVESLHMHQEHPRGFLGGLRARLIPFRGHRWMYDADSTVALLQRHLFTDIAVLEPGLTMINDPEPLNLREREPESLYVEARKPQ